MLRACADYDRLGKQQFLDTYGFGEATKYLVRVEDRLYDSKAIVGVAYSYERIRVKECSTVTTSVAV